MAAASPQKTAGAPEKLYPENNQASRRDRCPDSCRDIHFLRAFQLLRQVRDQVIIGSSFNLPLPGRPFR